jgi:hypothetical protein
MELLPPSIGRSDVRRQHFFDDQCTFGATMSGAQTDGARGGFVETTALRHVSVWLDDLAPNRGAFAHALEWASRLRLPLHAVTLSSHQEAGPFIEPQVQMQACATACTNRSIPWQGDIWDGPFPRKVQEFLRPAELCVFGEALPSPLRRELLRQLHGSPQTSALLCPRSWQPVARVLVVHQNREPSNRFLDSVAQICLAFQVDPIVLTLARSEKEARIRRQFAEETLTAHGMAADFDCFVGCDLCTGVALEARWRRCSHVFMERDNVRPWFRWLGRDKMQRLSKLLDWLTFLTI